MSLTKNSEKNFGCENSKRNSGVKNIMCIKKMLGSEKDFWVQKIVDLKKCWALRKLLIKKKRFLVWKNFVTKKVWSKNILVHKNYDSQKIGSKKFGQNRTSNSWDIAYMDKCHQGICCQDKCHHNSWHLLNMVQRSYL